MRSVREYGVCPVCDGTRRQIAPAEMLSASVIKNGWYGYSAFDGKVKCYNCGGQTMGEPCGKVTLRPDGTPCKHSIGFGKTIGNCLNEYTCELCNWSYVIDSGD